MVWSLVRFEADEVIVVRTQSPQRGAPWAWTLPGVLGYSQLVWMIPPALLGEEVDMGDSETRLALVTGGSFGLGLALCRHLIAANYAVLACGRSQDRLQQAAAELLGLRTLPADITQAADCDRLFDAIGSAAEPLELLVNNAAISRAHDYTSDYTLQQDRARDEIETNFAAPVELIRRFLALRREKGWEARPATIANVSTPGALFPLEPNPIYSCSKAGFHFFTSSLRRQLAETAVRVVEIFPPALDTGLAPDMNIPGVEENGPEVIDEVAQRSVEGILAGDPLILPHPQSEALVSAVGDAAERVADGVNQTLSRKEDWNRS